MSASDVFLCPACNAKLRFARRPRDRVTCPRCGHQFDYNEPLDAEDENLDPFIELAARTHGDDDEEEPLDDFQAALNDAVDEHAPVDDDEYGLPAAPVASVRQRTAAATNSTKLRNDEPAKKAAKKRKPRAEPRSDAIWLYLGVVGVLSLVLFVAIVIIRPAIFFGRWPTPDNLAGTYISERNPAIKLIFGADGSCALAEQDKNGMLNLGGLIYTIHGRKIVIEQPEEMKPKPRQPIFLDERKRGPQLSMTNIIVGEISDLTYKDGTLVSPSLGRFVRELQPDEKLGAPEGAPSGDHVASAAKGPPGARPAKQHGPGGIERIALAADGSLAVTGGADGTVLVWDPKTGKTIAGWNTQFPSPTLALSPDGSRLFLRARALRLMDPRSGLYLQPDSSLLEGTTWSAHSFSADGRLLLVTTTGQVVQLLDGATGRELSHFEVFKGPPHPTRGIKQCALSPDGTVFHSMTVLFRVPREPVQNVHTFLQAWNLETGRPERSTEVPDQIILAGDPLMVISQDGKTLAIVVWGAPEASHAIQLRRVLDGTVMGEIKIEGKWHHLACLAFTNGDKTITAAAVGMNSYRQPDAPTSLSEWDVASGNKLRDFQQPTQWRQSAICQQGRRLMYTTEDTVPHFFDLEAWKPLTD